MSLSSRPKPNQIHIVKCPLSGHFVYIKVLAVAHSGIVIQEGSFDYPKLRSAKQDLGLYLEAEGDSFKAERVTLRPEVYQALDKRYTSRQVEADSPAAILDFVRG